MYVDEEEFDQYFGEDISEICRNNIWSIIENDRHIKEFNISSEDAVQIREWYHLGTYIANNSYLKRLKFDKCNIDDQKMSAFLLGLVGSNSLREMVLFSDFDDNSFGIDGLRTMIPFLQKSPQIETLMFGLNDNFNTECFELLMSALNGKDIADLMFNYCSITDISALETYNLPNLRFLCLGGSKIGREGCMIIANLLQKENTTLRKLTLVDVGLGDQDADILANSLKQNNTLKHISLYGNNFTDKGHITFLQILNDISSTENTYKSNHTLIDCKLINGDNTTDEIQSLIKSACKLNRNSYVGRAKVISTQLNSQRRKRLCSLQGIGREQSLCEYRDYSTARNTGINWVEAWTE